MSALLHGGKNSTELQKTFAVRSVLYRTESETRGTYCRIIKVVMSHCVIVAEIEECEMRMVILEAEGPSQ